MGNIFIFFLFESFIFFTFEFDFISLLLVHNNWSLHHLLWVTKRYLSPLFGKSLSSWGVMQKNWIFRANFFFQRKSSIYLFDMLDMLLFRFYTTNLMFEISQTIKSWPFYTILKIVCFSWFLGQKWPFLTMFLFIWYDMDQRPLLLCI